MDAIREYLNNLFMGVTETPDTLRAKAELLQMMEDKYEELISEGRSEEEAVGKVISEFGNFDEIAKELGIEDVIHDTVKEEQGGSYPPPSYTDKSYTKFIRWTKDDIDKYVTYAKRHAVLVALGVALCIFAPYINDITEIIFDRIATHDFSDAVSTLFFFASIAGAVAAFITAHQMSKRYSIKKYAVVLNTDEYDTKNPFANLNSGRSACLIVGIVLTICAPAADSFGELLPGLMGDVFGESFLLLVAIGVGFIVYACSISNRVKNVLKALERAQSDPELSRMSDTAYRWDADAPKPISGITVALIVIACIISFGVMITISTVIPLTSYIVGGTSRVVEYAKDEEQSFAIDGLDTVTLNISAGQVKIIPSDDDTTIDLSYKGLFGGDPVIDNGELRIDGGNQDQSKVFGSLTELGEIDVRIPRNAALKYNLNIKAGDLELEGIHSLGMNADVKLGNMNIDDCVLEGRTNINMKAGDIDISDSDIEDISSELKAGNYIYRFKDVSEADMFSFDLHVNLGNISLFGEEKSGAGDITKEAISSTDTKAMKVNTAMGNITIK